MVHFKEGESKIFKATEPRIEDEQQASQPALKSRKKGKKRPIAKRAHPQAKQTLKSKKEPKERKERQPLTQDIVDQLYCLFCEYAKLTKHERK